MKNGARQKYVQYTNRKETIWNVLEARLRRATADKFGPWQHGFSKGVGTCDMILHSDN